MFSSEWPHRGDSIEYTQHAIINIKRKPSQIIQNTIMSAAMGFFFIRDSRMSSKEFKTAVVFETSVFEAQKFYCNSQHCNSASAKEVNYTENG